MFAAADKAGEFFLEAMVHSNRDAAAAAAAATVAAAQR
jgi:hypothetical protein